LQARGQGFESLILHKGLRGIIIDIVRALKSDSVVKIKH
jgi:hypothetical protein